MIQNVNDFVSQKMDAVSEKTRRRWGEWFLTLPSLVMLILLVGLPTLIIILTAFRERGISGGAGKEWSLEPVRNVFLNPAYLPIIQRTLIYASLTTLLCILIGLPVAYMIARANSKLRTYLILLVVIPFWTNMLVHISAWKMALHPNGAISMSLKWLGLIGENDLLLYNPQAVVLILVYVFLPFAILPLYAAIQKFDFILLESARDLGASKLQAITRIFLPGISGGIVAASLLVFVPVLGCYIVPELVGNPYTELLANKIAQRTFQDRNLPEAAALSAGLLLMMLLVWMMCSIFSAMKKRKEGTV